MERVSRLRLIGMLLVLLVAAGAAVAEPEAKSAILFIGDGMGPMQILIGQAANGGEKLRMQRMPVSGTVWTLNGGGWITDSADASTALSSGHKTADHLGLDMNGRRTWTTAEEAMAEGKSVGIISNDSICGATPAGFIAHVESRSMYPEIAEQVARSGAMVLMGVGKDGMLPKSRGGDRDDSRDIVAEMQQAGYRVVYNRDELLRLTTDQLRILGVFEDDTAPTLAEQVSAALKRLSTDEQGFMLVVEQARVDWKVGDPSGVAQDVLALDKAVQVALNYATTAGDTLVVVTADHETGGLLIVDPEKPGILAQIPRTAGDIAAQLNADRSNIKAVMKQYAAIPDLTEAELQQIATAKDAEAAVGAVIGERAGLKWCTGDHTMTPVRVYAYGPGSERFCGDMDNTDIAKRMGRAFESFWAD
ncbi:MAG: alkaline phosphatase [Armatimonadota bacterium]